MQSSPITADRPSVSTVPYIRLDAGQARKEKMSTETQFEAIHWPEGMEPSKCALHYTNQPLRGRELDFHICLHRPAHVFIYMHYYQ